MSRDSDVESERSSTVSSPHTDGPSKGSATKKKSSKLSKPRLTTSQKNTNHKDAENKRRNAIRERFTDLSHMVPGAEGLERSEQVMLSKTTDFLKEMLEEQRRLEALAEQRKLPIDESKKLRDDDYGGANWQQPNLEAYNAMKAKRQGDDMNDRRDGIDE